MIFVYTEQIIKETATITRKIVVVITERNINLYLFSTDMRNIVAINNETNQQAPMPKVTFRSVTIS